MSLPPVVAELVERFERHRDAYRSGQYNEAQLREEFLNPFFEALGWDVYNKQGFAEVYKEVVHEDAVKVGGRTKAPDYCFRVGGGVRSFFVEAKKPSVDIGEAPGPAYQLRRYAWSAKLPVSILTDFEEFAVYDCRVRPAKTDKASTARVLFRRYTEYAECWDELQGLFSPQAIRRGALDRFVASKKVKKGTAEVDTAFLGEIESWRDALARNLALRNPGLAERDLNYAVQATIDRLVFLRICEDRGVEPYGTLQSAANGPGVYGRLVELFQRADQRYNSGLFHFDQEKGRPEEPDRLTLGLVIDDRPLRAIIANLYYPESPYEFSVFPAEILGQVYEQFLGKVIRLTKGHQARVEEKPEVRKAGGVYYTPTYIVDYIVRHTVGALLEGGLTPKQAARLRILDPACGSGSFLIGAYEYLLKWHRDWYAADGPERHARGRRPRVYRHPSGEWRLTTAHKKEILLNNIYGVDIDPQAVEVTKLSLLLKVLEGESQETLAAQLRLFHERALPDLAGNVKCGNSLVGPDFYQGRQRGLLDEDEVYRINAFDWHDPERGFGRILAQGGFDAVIGNPPYVRQESLRELKPYLKSRFEAFESTADLYAYFIERGLSLLRDGGRMSLIVSSGFLRTNFARALREHILANAAVESLVDFGGLPVFAAAKDTYVCVPVLEKNERSQEIRITRVTSLDGLDLPARVASDSYAVPPSRFSPDAWRIDEERVSRLFDKLVASGIPLGRYLNDRIFLGVKTGLNEAFELEPQKRDSIVAALPDSAVLLRPFLGGQDIRRYGVRRTENYLIAVPCGWTRATMSRQGAAKATLGERDAWRWFSKEFGPLADHLAPFADRARQRQDQGDFWWELRPCDYYGVLDGPKIIYPDIAKHPRFHVDTHGTYVRNTAYCLASDDYTLLGILNSRLAWFAIARISIPFGTRAGEYRYRLFTQYIEQIPLPREAFAAGAKQPTKDRIASLARDMTALRERLDSAKTAHERDVLDRQTHALDREIDQLVYELYGLTEEEIAIVEGGSRQ